VSEIVSSVSMLAITIAVLGGIGFISIGSLHAADGLLQNGSQNDVANAGVLITVVGTQENSSGTFVWLFDYGWEQAKLSTVSADGGLLQGWSSNCNPLMPKNMCVVRLPGEANGTVTLLFGDRTISLPV
jgi:hypothetical protein